MNTISAVRIWRPRLVLFPAFRFVALRFSADDIKIILDIVQLPVKLCQLLQSGLNVTLFLYRRPLSLNMH